VTTSKTGFKTNKKDKNFDERFKTPALPSGYSPSPELMSSMDHGFYELDGK